jgi:predicted metal-dependent hydrolase
MQTVLFDSFKESLRIETIAYSLVRSSRRTVALVIRSDGTLEVRAPRFASVSEIERFIVSKRLWIDKKTHEVKKREAKTSQQFTDGGKVLLFGREFKLTVSSKCKRALLRDDHILCPEGGEVIIRKNLVQLMRREAKKYITDKVDILAKRFGFRYEKVRISSAKTRWGSCSSRGTLSFSYRLITAPEKVIDSVILHELCHTREMNHSKRFYVQLAKVDPEYKLSNTWLKEHQGIMMV